MNECTHECSWSEKHQLQHSQTTSYTIVTWIYISPTYKNDSGLYKFINIIFIGIYKRTSPVWPVLEVLSLVEGLKPSQVKSFNNVQRRRHLGFSRNTNKQTNKHTSHRTISTPHQPPFDSLRKKRNKNTWMKKKNTTEVITSAQREEKN